MIKETSIMAAILLIWIVIHGLKEMHIYLKDHTVLRLLLKPNFIMNQLKSIHKIWFIWPKITLKDSHNMQYQMLSLLIIFIENIFMALFTPSQPLFPCSQIKFSVKVLVHFAKVYSWLKPLIEELFFPIKRWNNLKNIIKDAFSILKLIQVVK